jgi:CMP-N,N'-diacetyllegionaminic acid synthase
MPLDGKPMLAYTIEAALRCVWLGGVYVSSEDADVLRLAADLGASVIQRPSELAADEVQNTQVVRLAIEALAARGERFGHVVLLQPTSPLRTARHLDACLAAYLQSEARSTMSVCAAQCHPRAMVVVRNGFAEPYEPGADLDLRTDGLAPTFQPNGAIHALATGTFLSQGRFVVAPCLPYHMSREESVDVDTEFELALAEALLQSRRRGERG